MCKTSELKKSLMNTGNIKKTKRALRGKTSSHELRLKTSKGPIHRELVDMIRLSHFYVWCQAAEWF